MTQPVSLAFNLPFTDAIESLSSRRVVLPDDYWMMPAAARKEAFMLMGLSDLDQVAAVRDKMTNILKTGGSLKDLQNYAATLDWDITPDHLETIYRNSVQTAYNAGAWKRFERGKANRPYLMYSAVNDSRTRPAHRAISGIIRPVDDPFWHDHSPPLGHRCRCRLLALTAAEAEARSGGSQGLNKAVTSEMVADGPSWGRKPTQRDETLTALGKQKQRGAPPVIAQAFDRLNRALPMLDDAGAKLPGLAPLPGQLTWRDAGRLDLRDVGDTLRLPRPALLPAAADRAGALQIVAEALGVSLEKPLRSVQTPVESALIRYDLLTHVVDKLADARERYANFIIPTLEFPFEIWAVEYPGDLVRNRYIGLFQGERDLLVSVRVNLDGSVVWNIMQADDRKMNAHRIGELIYGGG